VLGLVILAKTFLLLAVLVFLNTIPILFHKEPERIKSINSNNSSNHSKIDSIKQYLHYFSSSPQLKAWLLVLITFKIVDGLTGPILKPLAVDLGLTFSQIGLYITILGAVAALLGAAIAGCC
jgi:hypothetical protein